MRVEGKFVFAVFDDAYYSAYYIIRSN